jgi:hypothetical protein
MSVSHPPFLREPIAQTPYIIEVNTPANSLAAAHVSTAASPSFITRTDKGLIVNGTLVT